MRPSVRIRTGLLAAGLVAGAALGVEGDVTMKRKEGGENGVPPAVFPHWIHRVRYRCYACHDDLFKMRAGEGVVTMVDIAQGKACGACHDGKTAWEATYETCNRCHVAR